MEITIGVIQKDSTLHVLNPSLTIAEGEVLSLEEKFQGGTGINITPPPRDIINPRAIAHTKELIYKVAQALGIKGYSRIDAFMNIHTGNVTIIEVNTLPGLTPSTILFHQGLAENPSINPTELLELFISNKGY